MSRTDYAEIEIRKELRSYHFEDPRYNRLSHILGTETYKEKYGSRRDDLMILSLIVGREILSHHKLYVDEVLKHQDDVRVNWKAIYQYIDTRLDDDEAKWKKELVNYQRSLPVTIKDFLDDYRSLLLQEFDMI